MYNYYLLDVCIIDNFNYNMKILYYKLINYLMILYYLYIGIESVFKL